MQKKHIRKSPVQIEVKNLKCKTQEDQNNFIKLGNLIREARTERGMSLRELYALTGINHKTIHKIETAGYKTINPILLAKISNVLKLDFVKMMILAGYFEVVFKLRYENISNERK